MLGGLYLFLSPLHAARAHGGMRHVDVLIGSEIIAVYSDKTC